MDIKGEIINSFKILSDDPEGTEEIHFREV